MDGLIFEPYGTIIAQAFRPPRRVMSGDQGPSLLDVLHHLVLSRELDHAPFINLKCAVLTEVCALLVFNLNHSLVSLVELKCVGKLLVVFSFLFDLKQRVLCSLLRISVRLT